jgi:TPR repeat protein
MCLMMLCLIFNILFVFLFACLHQLFERGAALDDPRAMVAWAICLEHGIGTANNDIDSHAAAAHRDHSGAAAANMNGNMNGTSGQDAGGGRGDPMRAVDLYRRAALHHGDARAMFQLGQVWNQNLLYLN